MTRKEILVFQLREIRNEFADALADLTQEQLTARPIEGRNPIGWIACHCINNFDFFIHPDIQSLPSFLLDSHPASRL